jgi:hypothetical protein
MPSNTTRSQVCPQCGGFKRNPRAKQCRPCHYQNGRGPVVHREDGTTLLPLPHGKYTVIDTEDYDRVKDQWWHFSGNGYVAAVAKGPHNYLLHRFILDVAPEDVVDHLNHDPLDNRKSNLAVGTQTENMHNLRPRADGRRRGIRRLPSSKMSGPTWVAYIRKDGKKHWLGTFSTEMDAVRAYNRAAIHLYGDRAVLNDLPESEVVQLEAD